MINLEACPHGNEELLLGATRSAISDHLRMLGSTADNPVPVMSQKKITDWSVQEEILGMPLTRRGWTIAIPTNKTDEALTLLPEWPNTRRWARAKEVVVRSWTRKLRHLTTVVRAGKYFVRRRLGFVTGLADND